MATTTLIIIISALVGNLIILYLPIDKLKKALLCGMIGVALLIVAIVFNAQNYSVPAIYNEKARIALSERLQANAAPKIEVEPQLKTPLELAGGCLIALGLTLGIFLVVAVRNSNNKEADQAHQIAKALTIIATAYVLSLYYGLELAVVAWVKKKPSEENVSTSAEGSINKTVLT